MGNWWATEVHGGIRSARRLLTGNKRTSTARKAIALAFGRGAGVTVPHVGEAGALNADSYRAQAAAVLATYPQLDVFAAQLDRAMPGTNVDVEKVLSFDLADAILDRRALFVAEAGGDRAKGLAAFDAQPWSPRRQAFEDLWQDGRRFVYCAPNPGTLGALKYGDYCLSIDPQSLEQALGLVIRVVL